MHSNTYWSNSLFNINIMNQKQMMHVGMINSYSVLTGKETVDNVIKAGVGVFAHVPDEEPSLEAIEFMIFYFKEIEMYEKCAVLHSYIEHNYNEDGSFKEEQCQCEHPEIDEYIPKVKCYVCSLRLKR